MALRCPPPNEGAHELVDGCFFERSTQRKGNRDWSYGCHTEGEDGSQSGLCHGSSQLMGSAKDANGCKQGADRPVSLTVFELRNRHSCMLWLSVIILA